MKFNEDSRVKIPAILHLMKLGYKYVSLRNTSWDKNTNIFPDLFKEGMQNVNPQISESQIESLYQEITLKLDNEDLGKAFYERLTETSDFKLIDFENIENNVFHICTELPYEKDDDNFRPDIICLINGMPLVFIEVKKPNNREGIIAEYDRIQRRFKNKKFRKFINLTQMMIFSNNMEYDNSDPKPIEGAFYATTSYKKAIFNYFREEENFNLSEILKNTEEKEEDLVLKDTNLQSIKGSAELEINKNPNTPTNRILTSLLQKERLLFFLRYAIAYVKDDKGDLQKHIMRYPQYFATKAIAKHLEADKKSGIIWHTQGSGKTALAYFNVKHLTDFYKKRNVIPKFYFIVDRLDLLTQASREFTARGLVVHQIQSKSEFVKTIKSNKAVHNDEGKPEITVINIQKFQDEERATSTTDYNLDVQRIYFLDEVHRSYNPEGSFLANLKESDPNAIRIGLTGTPLLGNNYNSRTLFGDYIHKYYYNQSIADGYTLRLIREEIETSYKMQMQEALDRLNIEVLKGQVKKEDVFADYRFCTPMLKYIIDDFEQKRIATNDPSIGAMVICDSAEQARMLYELFNKSYVEFSSVIHINEELAMVAEPAERYGNTPKAHQVKKARLILYDSGTKEDLKNWVKDFKKGGVDILFVYNMLLTGFDAPRLKKLYFGRKIKAHNLLQALTRVNRTYKDFQYGFVVDFADIQKEFQRTNEDYFKELQGELGDEIEHYENLFKSREEIENDIEFIKDTLFRYDTQNKEIFQQQISQINERKEMLEIVKALNLARSLYNLIRLKGDYELLQKLDFKNLSILARGANDRLAMINFKENLSQETEVSNLLNIALEDIIFAFTKVGEEEMKIADELKNKLRQTREMLGGNFDPKAPEFISLKEELERLFHKRNFTEVSQTEMTETIRILEEIYTQAQKLERENQLLKAKYQQDEKYARLHKRLLEKNPLNIKERQLFEVLSELKTVVDAEVLSNARQIEHEGYLKKMMARLVKDTIYKKNHINIDFSTTIDITTLMVNEYTNERLGRAV